MATILTVAERGAIRAVAAGDTAKLDTARAAFHRAAPAHGVQACVELQFMAEALAPAPDLPLLSQYREAVLKGDTSGILKDVERDASLAVAASGASGNP
jgi:hypothetical protein